MLYAVYILNVLSHSTLDRTTPIQAAFGITPDISIIFCFQFYQKVLYKDPSGTLPGGSEKSGRFVGFAENIGDALTFLIWTDNTQELIVRSEI